MTQNLETATITPGTEEYDGCRAWVWSFTDQAWILDCNCPRCLRKKKHPVADQPSPTEETQ